MKKIFTCVLAALTIAACSKEGDLVSGTSPFILSFEGGMTAAEADEMSRAGYDGAKSVWTAGDAIGVTLGADNSNLQFAQVDGSLSADGTKVRFAGELNNPVTGNVECVAYYPYSADASVSGKTITTTFPAMQSYMQNGYGGIPLFGSYSGDVSAMQMQFKNLFSVVKLTLTKDPSVSGAVKLESIAFRGNNNETVSGAMSVDMSGATPVVSYTGTGKSITLDCGNGVELTSTPQTFYIAVPAMTYANGFTFTFKTDKGYIVKSVKSAGATYAANKIYDTPPLALNNFLIAVIIPDLNLRNLLSTLGLAQILDPVSGMVSITAAGLAVATIDISGGSVSSLVGIENFPALVTLDCSNNQLTSLDVSNNPLLVTLNCSNNQLTSLDVSNNPLLLTLNCSNNQLTSLTLGTSALLANLNCGTNQLTALDLHAKTALLTLDCSNNKLVNLNVSNNILLTDLRCSGNNGVNLNISGLEALLSLYLNSTTNSVLVKVLTVPSDAAIGSLTANNGIWLTFNCVNNTHVKTISLKNNLVLAALTVTGNSALTSLDLTSTPLLLLYTTNNNAPGFAVVGKGGIL